MRVAVDLTLAGRADTGTRVYARRLSEALQRRSSDVVVWEKELGKRAHRLGRLVNAARLATWLAIHAPRRIAQEGVEIYHAPCNVGPFRAACPRVMTVHDATALTMRSLYDPWWRLYVRIFGVTAVRRAQAVIVPSRASRDEVALAYRVATERIWVTPEGVLPEFRPVDSRESAPVLERYGIRPPYILFVGPHRPRKNLARLIEAYELMRRSAPSFDVQLVLAGPPGPSDQVVKALVERFSLGEHVLLSGWVRQEDLPALYSAATCLALPSLAEGFGLPILEAMACGTPVVTSDRSSMPEVAGEAALFVNPLLAESIADGLCRILAEADLRRELIGRGLERARLFTWERTAQATESVYRSVMRARPNAQN